MKLCEQSKCTGCQACRAICPKSAIAMAETIERKTVPVVNEELCINCGLCERTCPVLKEPDFRTPLKTYAAWTLNEEDQKKAASGGIASGLYRYIISKGGTIYGCEFDESLRPVIKQSVKETDLSKFRSSKYVQSFTEDTYNEVKKNLQDGRIVLYVGSPCQIDGLTSFLSKPYDNLYTVDIICHGVPPYAYLKDYVEKIANGKKISNIGFRDDKGYCFTLYEGENIVYNKGPWKDYYITAFLEGITFRDNCYQCRYARKERISDLTIGDFWGLDKNTLNKQFKGRVSVILANTQKGDDLLSGISSIYTEERTLEEAIKENRQLNNPMPIHKDREVFLKNLHKGVYKALISTSLCRKLYVKNSIKDSSIYKIIKGKK